MSENSKNEVEFQRNMYFPDLNLAREARLEKLSTQAKPNKTHCQGPDPCPSRAAPPSGCTSRPEIQSENVAQK